MKYEVVTLCNFGNPERASILCRHTTEHTAANAWGKLRRIYHGIHHWRVWQAKWAIEREPQSADEIFGWHIGDTIRDTTPKEQPHDQ